MMVSRAIEINGPIAFRMGGPDAKPFEPRGEAEHTTRNKRAVDVQRFRKDILRTGQYVKESEGRVFDIGPDLLKHFVKQFKRMKANGKRVPIPDTHEAAEKGRARDNMGWVDELYIDGDTLYMDCEIIGDDAIKAASRADVSIHTEPEITDGKGNRYAHPIDHVALCTDPVVPGLREFIPLALSLKFQQRSLPMELLQRIASALGMTADQITSLEQGEAEIIARIVALNETIEELRQRIRDFEAASADQQEEAAEAVVEAAATVVEEAAATPAPAQGSAEGAAMSSKPAGRFSQRAAIPAEMVDVFARNRELEIASLLDSGQITPPMAEYLATEYIGSNNERIVFSLKSGEGNKEFKRVISLLSMNKGLSFGEKTGPQIVPLADKLKADDNENIMIETAKKMSAGG